MNKEIIAMTLLAIIGGLTAIMLLAIIRMAGVI